MSFIPTERSERRKSNGLITKPSKPIHKPLLGSLVLHHFACNSQGRLVCAAALSNLDYSSAQHYQFRPLKESNYDFFESKPLLLWTIQPK
jgi:hypothetical protein